LLSPPLVTRLGEIFCQSRIIEGRSVLTLNPLIARALNSIVIQIIIFAIIAFAAVAIIAYIDRDEREPTVIDWRR